MSTTWSRRAMLRGSAVWMAATCGASLARAAPERQNVPIAQPSEVLAALEKKSGGTLGVAILDTESGKRVGFREHERFPMCSTFKLLAAAAVLARVDQKAERLDRRISYGKADLLEHAPTARARVAEGSMSVADLCEAAITVSDNTAANLLLTLLGGPAALTAFARSLGDTMTRLDRMEPLLNAAAPGDPRDTTTPAAMLVSLHALLIGKALSNTSRERLEKWLIANTTGGARLRAGTPSAWRVGDKTGTGARGSTNDVAILWPPGRKPLLIAAYIRETALDLPIRNEVLAGVARFATS